jgi:predicted nucleotidyltransferase component of viral defense system
MTEAFLVFKGGTSLSKPYKAIERFSEDIDVTYDIRVIAEDLVEDTSANLNHSHGSLNAAEKSKNGPTRSRSECHRISKGRQKLGRASA